MSNPNRNDQQDSHHSGQQRLTSEQRDHSYHERNQNAADRKRSSQAIHGVRSPIAGKRSSWEPSICNTACSPHRIASAVNRPAIAIRPPNRFASQPSRWTTGWRGRAFVV
jgi:hypothetical protein